MEAHPIDANIGKRQRLIPALAILTAFVTPIACLPYLLYRRRITKLQTRMDNLSAVLTELRNDVQGLSSQTAMRREEYQRIKTTLHEIMEETEDVRSQIHQRETAQGLVNSAIRSDLRVLLDERQHHRDQTAVLRSLGTSLASIAAFIYQVQLEGGYQTFGKDSHEVEMLRLVAYKLQNLPEQPRMESTAYKSGASSPGP